MNEMTPEKARALLENADLREGSQLMLLFGDLVIMGRTPEPGPDPENSAPACNYLTGAAADPDWVRQVMPLILAAPELAAAFVEVDRARPLMPGELCMHKGGTGPYEVMSRYLAASDHQDGEVDTSKTYEVYFLSDVRQGEPAVMYGRPDELTRFFVRSVRNFDEPGRFTRLADTSSKTAPSADPVSCGHCWHGTGVVLTSMPAQYPEVCCRCGEKRNRRESTPSTAGHGPFLPALGRGK